ncbi:PadR family transcriptional regulator [Modestobacter sp. I12A-02662]|uniref:PadR family transcriptional regulator n=1 Tax=Modestobacter sp. I12A-02662 TaxID=1730496 RepID=UPI0034DFC45F
MVEERWPGEWMRGVLSLCVLRVVADGPTYGYAIAGRLADAGLGSVKGGTLYPILARLEADGLVTSSWEAGDAGPGRKFFTLTGAGTSALGERTEQWHAFTQRAAALLSSPHVPA